MATPRRSKLTWSMIPPDAEWVWNPEGAPVPTGYKGATMQKYSITIKGYEEKDIPLEFWKYKVFKFKNGAVIRTPDRRMVIYFSKTADNIDAVVFRSTILVDTPRVDELQLPEHDIIKKGNKKTLLERVMVWNFDRFMKYMPEAMDHIFEVGKKLKEETT